MAWKCQCGEENQSFQTYCGECLRQYPGTNRVSDELAALRTERDLYHRRWDRCMSDYSDLRTERDRLRAALEEIAKGEGPYSTNQQEFAENVIENLTNLARHALGGE